MRLYIIFSLLTALWLAPTHAEYRILAFGDSNTWGWKPDGSGTRFADAERWPGVLQTELGSEYTVVADGLVARRTDLDGLDAGPVSGSFLNGAQTLPAAIARNAPLDLVILFLGTNDLQLGAQRDAESVASAVVGLAKLAKECKGLLYSSYTAPTEVWIIVPPTFGDLSNSPLKGLFSVGEAESQQLDTAFESMFAESTDKLFFVNTLSATPTGPDGIHLTQATHTALGQAIANALKAEHSLQKTSSK